MSTRILFNKVTVMLKCQSLKKYMQYIPISEVDRKYMSLPRQEDDHGLIRVKLKCKADYRSYVLFEPRTFNITSLFESVRPSFVGSFLKIFKAV